MIRPHSTSPRIRFLPLVFLGLALLPVLAACGEGAPGPEPADVPEWGTEEETAAADAEAEARTRVKALMNARIFSGTGGPVLEDGVIVVRGGVVSRVGPRDEVDVPDDAEVTDLEGRFVLPGLVNAHGHVGPGGDVEDVEEQLGLYAHYGVTTVLSLGDEAEVPAGERWSPSLQRARLFVSGPSLRPDGPQEAEAAVTAVIAEGADWIKQHVNDSWGRDTYREVIAAARERSRPVAIHIEHLGDARGVLEAGATLLAHSVRDEPVDQALIEGMRERGVCLTPTLTRELSTFVYRERPDFFDDPFFLERAAPEDLDAWLTPQRQAAADGDGARYWEAQLPLAKENMVRLHETGAGIALGTDSGPAGRWQGYFEHVEMEMMVEAGMAPADVLVAATGAAARCMGLEGIIGTIEPGVWADFLVLDADPLEDIRNTREIHGVWTAGNRLPRP